jgi:lipopolysaccharide biosynthesis glycosyltransferase
MLIRWNLLRVNVTSLIKLKHLKYPAGQKLKVKLVTGSDAAFWPLAELCVDSLMNVRRELSPSYSIEVCFLDAGISSSQTKTLASWAVRSAKADVDESLLQGRNDPATLIKICKLLLPQTFPGGDVYIWVDADAWVQDPGAICKYIEKAHCSDIAVSSQRDLEYSFPKSYVNRWRLNRALVYYGRREWLRMFYKPYFNSGVFAVKASSPALELWREQLIIALSKHAVEISDQTALNFLSNSNMLRIGRLSALHNWTCHLSAPRWLSSAGIWVTPLFRRKIGIVHDTNSPKNLLLTHHQLG